MTGEWCNHLKEGDIFLHKMSEDFVLIFRDGGLLGLGSDGGMIDYDFIPDYKSVTVFGNGCEFRVTAEMHDGYLKAYNAMKKQEGEGWL